MFGLSRKRKDHTPHSEPPDIPLEYDDDAMAEATATPPEEPPAPLLAVAPPCTNGHETSLLGKALAQFAATESALRDAVGAVADVHSELHSVQLAITNNWEDGQELQELLVRREVLMTLQARAELQEKSARLAHKSAENRLQSLHREIERHRDMLREHVALRERVVHRIVETRNRLSLFETELEEHDQRVARMVSDLERLGGSAELES